MAATDAKAFPVFPDVHAVVCPWCGQPVPFFASSGSAPGQGAWRGECRSDKLQRQLGCGRVFWFDTQADIARLVKPCQ